MALETVLPWKCSVNPITNNDDDDDDNFRSSPYSGFTITCKIVNVPIIFFFSKKKKKNRWILFLTRKLMILIKVFCLTMTNIISTYYKFMIQNLKIF